MDKLEIGQRLAELNTLSRVLNGGLVGTGGDASSHPSDHKARGL